MLSSTFMQEGRLKIELPQASLAPTGKQKSRSDRRHGHAERQLPRQRSRADQLLPRHAARGHHRSRGRRSQQAGHRARRWARHAPVGGHRDGCARQARLRAHQHRDGRRVQAARNEPLTPMNSAPPPPDASAAKVYRRLLSYARPHRGMFMIGVLGMALFAATDGAFAFFVQNSSNGHVRRDGDPEVFWLIPIGAPVLFLLRGIGDYMSNYFPGLCRPPGHQGHPRRPVPPVPAPAGELLRSRVGRHVAVAAHVQHRAGGRGHHQVHHLADPRLADHRRADRLDVLSQLAARDVRVPDRAAAVVAGAQGDRVRSGATARASRRRWATSRAW